MGAPVKIVGIATGAPTFAVEWDENNKLKIFPVKHGEDLSIDKEDATLFRQQTQSSINPKGVGAGTWFMREQIKRSMSNPKWVHAGRDNEHSADNAPITGLMASFE